MYDVLMPCRALEAFGPLSITGGLRFLIHSLNALSGIGGVWTNGASVVGICRTNDGS